MAQILIGITLPDRSRHIIRWWDGMLNIRVLAIAHELYRRRGSTVELVSDCKN